MSAKKELKIFRKTSIEYLKKMYNNSVTYIFDRNTWRSTSPEYYGESKVLLHTRKSIKRLGNELMIFKAPTIVGLKITYYKSMAFLFDRNSLEHQLIPVSEANYLLRDLSNPINTTDQSEKELRIFSLPSIDKLESMYYKSIGK